MNITKKFTRDEKLTVGRAGEVSVWLSVLSIVTTISSCINLSIFGCSILLIFSMNMGYKNQLLSSEKADLCRRQIMWCPALMTPLDFYIQS